MNQSEVVQTLLEVVQEHPDLPIVAMVNSEVVVDDYCAYWMGEWGACEIKKYWMGNEHVHFYDDNDWDELCEVDYDGGDIGTDDIDFDLNEDNIIERYKELPWVEAIVIYIEVPNDF